MLKSVLFTIVMVLYIYGVFVTSYFKAGFPLMRTVTVEKYRPSGLNGSPAVDKSKEYWQGDWVCADCGYVYDRDIDGGGKYFEEQGKGFICPQCSAPRRRYAKKVGDKWGVTNDGGDLPIYAFTFLGLLATAWFTFYYVPTL